MSRVDFSWVFQQPHQQILSFLKGEARFVGGAVRNTLLGKVPQDFDLATRLSPEEVIHCLSSQGLHVIPTGLAHGTVTAMYKTHTYEITTLRRDVQTDGRHATVVFTDSWEEDAARRDFTINALFLDGEARLYDYFRGAEDLALGVIRFIGDPWQRIREDYLRILRFFRFHVYYGHHYDQDSLEACIQLKSFLLQLSKERVTKEILKILESHHPWSVLSFLKDNDFFLPLFGKEATLDLQTPLAFIESELSLQLPALVRLSTLAPEFPRLMLSRAQTSFLSAARRPLILSYKEIVESLFLYGPEVTKARVVLSAAPFVLEDSLVLSSLKENLDLCERQFPLFPLKGADLLQEGIQAGPKISETLDELRRWWIALKCRPTREECLQHYRSGLR
jgi:poly(A) polymerase